MRRVARGPVVVLTCDPRRVEEFWLAEYAPEILAAEARRYPALEDLAAGRGGRVPTSSVLIPQGCTDGVAEASYGPAESLRGAGGQLASPAGSPRGRAAVLRL